MSQFATDTVSPQFCGADPNALVESPAPAGSAAPLGHKKLVRAMRRSGGLFDSAAAALQRTIAADPDNVVALLRLGDVYRGLGKLPKALECYRRVVSLCPGDPKARRLAALLGGDALPDAPPGARPMPFVHVTDFLPARRCSALLALALASRDRFEAGRVVNPPAAEETDSPPTAQNGVVDLRTRRCLLADRRITERKVRPWFEAQLRAAFAQTLPRLQMREPTKYWIEMAMSAYRGGGFFNRHRDDDVSALRSRKVSFVYYFHRRPQRFSGGELLLYDGDGTRGFTQIEPRHNSIVLFPAACIHEVAAIESDSADFADARFAIHGWLRTYSAQENILHEPPAPNE